MIPFVPVTDAMIQHPDPKDWLSWRRTLDSWGYSPLAQITKANVAQLRMVWVHPLDAGHQEGTPLVHDGVMYFPGPSDSITALDAASGNVLWQHKRDVLRRHCADVGRDPDEITMTWSPELFLRETEAEIGTESRSFWGEPFMARATGRDVPRYIFHVQPHSELVSRLVELERSYRVAR